MKNITKLPFLMSLFSVLVWIVTTLWLGVNYQSLPDRVVTHYNFFGVADRFGPKISLLIILAIGLVIYCFITYMHYISEKRSREVANNEEAKNQERIVFYASVMAAVLKTLLSVFFFYIIISSSRNANLFVLTTFFFLAGVVTTIVIFAVKSFKAGVTK